MKFTENEKCYLTQEDNEIPFVNIIYNDDVIKVPFIIMKDVCKCFSFEDENKKFGLLQTNGQSIELIEPDFDGISKVIDSISKLYDRTSNHELVDKILEHFTMPMYHIDLGNAQQIK